MWSRVKNRQTALVTAVTISKAENLVSLSRLKQVIDSSFDIIAITGKEGEISYVNPACEALTGYAVHEFTGKKLDALFGVQQVVPDHVRAYASSSVPATAGKDSPAFIPWSNRGPHP